MCAATSVASYSKSMLAAPPTSTDRVGGRRLRRSAQVRVVLHGGYGWYVDVRGPPPAVLLCRQCADRLTTSFRSLRRAIDDAAGYCPSQHCDFTAEEIAETDRILDNAGVGYPVIRPSSGGDVSPKHDTWHAEALQ